MLPRTTSIWQRDSQPHASGRPGAVQYQSPLDQYRDQLKANVGDMHDALQSVGVDAFKGIEDGLTGLLSGTESTKKAFKSMADSIISDLVRIGIEKLVLSAITGGSFFGLKLAGGGKVDGFAIGGIPGYAGGVTPNRSGNRIRGAGSGTSDSILARLTNGKFIRVANGEGIMTERAVNDYWPMLDAMNKGTFRGFADGGLPVPHALPDLSIAEVGRLSAGRQRIDIAVRGEEGPFFRPLVHSISSQHASIAQENGAEDGANRAQERAIWQRGRKLGGSR
jgi:hypothetical protein